MMIAYPAADICCKLSEEYITTLIFENQKMFYDIVSDIYNQLEGFSGKFVLSREYQPLDMRKNAELITQFVPFTVNQKELITKLYSVLKCKSVNENLYQKTNELLTDISKYLYILTEEFENELLFDVPDDIGGILKMFNVGFNDCELDLPEKILEYIIAVRNLKGERVFITVNMRSYLTENQVEQLFKNLILRKIKLICIENREYKKSSYEKRIIIDEDMCMI